MINRMFEDIQNKGKIIIHNSAISRPILGITDFYRAIEAIITKKTPSGIYNLASFNASIKLIAERVGKKIGGNIEEINTFPTYANFIMSSKKFEKTFHFSFQETIESIVDSLKSMPFNTSKSERK